MNKHSGHPVNEILISKSRRNKLIHVSTRINFKTRISSERRQAQNISIVWVHLYDHSEKGKPIGTVIRMVVSRDWGFGWRVTIKSTRKLEGGD
jgi:hypothetical protein